MFSSDIDYAVGVLRSGGLVAFPTETVYGLGADAGNPQALAKIFTAKNRPADHPLIIHLADISILNQWVADISPTANVLIHAFWPGPMTLIFKKAPGVSDMITGHQQTVGIRIPNHPVAIQLLKQFGGAVAAPSANRYGRISPTTANAVHEELGVAVDCILEGGQCLLGVESTIIDVSGDIPTILRPGMLSQADIETVLQQPVKVSSSVSSVRVSGSHESHYAPETVTYLMEANDIPVYLETLTADSLPVALVLHQANVLPKPSVDCVMMSSDPSHYAHQLYLTLRELDKKQYKSIIVEAVPQHPEWEAIRDRLKRAAVPIQVNV